MTGPAMAPRHGPAGPVAVDVASYDLILVNSSAGKDSQAMLDVVAELAAAAGVSDRVVVVHCDLGRVEWPGTRELAERQAAHYAFRFEVVRRDRGDLLAQIEGRGMFPSAAARYCTSDQKTAQVAKLMTRLVREAAMDRPVRILNCLGIRAQESPERARKPVFARDRATNVRRRHVDRWHPIHAWTLEDVWSRIRQSGVAPHPAYDAGMPRLSCCFCVLASKPALARSAKLNPELAEEYRALEERIGHTIKADLTMADIIAAGQADAGTGPLKGWAG